MRSPTAPRSSACLNCDFTARTARKVIVVDRRRFLSGLVAAGAAVVAVPLEAVAKAVPAAPDDWHIQLHFDRVAQKFRWFIRPGPYKPERPVVSGSTYWVINPDLERELELRAMA